MMDNLLHGRFDVDPDTVGKEGFLRDGRVYAYWGIFPALLRLPLILLPNGLHIDITRLSCAIAAVIMFFINYQSVRYIGKYALQNSPWMKKLLLVAVSFTGVQICFLRPSIYQEVCLWSLVFGMFFVQWAVRASLQPEETPKALIWMAVASALALLTRVSMGIGLYASESLFGLLVLWRCWRNTSGADAPLLRSWLRHCAMAILILVVGVVLTGIINFERWGNPLTFANYNLYLFNTEFPDRLVRTTRYGLFNVQRIPLGILYFFFPVWAFQNADGHLFLQDSFSRLIDAAELPPSSFFLTDGFFLLLGSMFIISLMRQRRQEPNVRGSSIAIMAGLTIPAILMLMAISMNFRYRAEFYPIMLYCGFMGAVAVAKNFHDSKLLKSVSISLVVIGVISSHFVLLLYDLSKFGPGSLLIKHGVVNYYLSHIGLNS
ncbi:hypothetical protein [Komagataeibacter sp. FNDCR2]|uniref:hypothetical protein n=1 Tax=Komagataeibacter sp. FNDCR2 TaxID=2878682 RepID=UPI001E2F4887|nr:hypothetical protein [Komagataeibacter sp. FNDCR2]MCE2574461.1 hypothetical protein [Komagataeibacter sp. FNDCR2]